jgi:hypothetical protein
MFLIVFIETAVIKSADQRNKRAPAGGQSHVRVTLIRLP